MPRAFKGRPTTNQDRCYIDALSSIEGSASYCTETSGGKALTADDLRATLALIRDIARDALCIGHQRT